MGFENLFSKSKFVSVLNEYPITFYDIGTRGGFDPDLGPIAFGVDAVGFEPDPMEFSRLNHEPEGPWRSSRILPFAIGDSIGRRTLHIPSEPEGASLLPPLQGLPPRLFKKQYFCIRNMIEVDTVTLQHVVDDAGEATPDCLKIDIEGLELGVLSSSPKILNNLMTVKVEVMYERLRKKQPVAHQIEAFMSENGFILMDVIKPAHWRTNGYILHPHTSNETIPYSRGQLIQGDYLFFRNYDDKNAGRYLSEAQLLKLVMLSMSYGYFDYAADILTHGEIKSVLVNRDVSGLLNSLSECSRRYGRLTARREFFNHLRLLGPYIRRFQNLVLR